MARKRKITGMFWPNVRQRIWQRAEELYMYEHREAETRPERAELIEGGYFYKAKVEVLKEISLEAKAHVISEENKG